MKRFFCFLSYVVLTCILTSCTSLNNLLRQTPQPEKAVLLFLPFHCQNEDITSKMSKGFTENLSKKVDLLELKNFALYLSSRSIQLPPEYNNNGQFTPEQIEKLINDIFAKDDVRETFAELTQIDYLVVGSAIEQKQTELELGNLVTASKAEIRMLELQSGEMLLEEGFKQGLFEIVAPDRIGKKLAARVNARLDQIKQEIKSRTRRNKKEKFRLKREEWRSGE